MIYAAPTIGQGGPSRVLVLKDWFKILIQVTSAGTIFIGTSKDEAGRIVLGSQQDGIQLNNVNANVPFDLWWKGELWVAGADPGTTFVIIIPGFDASESKEGICVGEEEMSYSE